MPSSSSHGGWKGGNIAKEYRIFLPGLPPTGYVKQPTLHGPGDASNLALKQRNKLPGQLTKLMCMNVSPETISQMHLLTC